MHNLDILCKLSCHCLRNCLSVRRDCLQSSDQFWVLAYSECWYVVCILCSRN